ncbi:hypothetical protein [Nocardia sp. NRRL S-836]|nr:hypothetical protein [Nocardia sp. NRRL S-836]
MTVVDGFVSASVPGSLARTDPVSGHVVMAELSAVVRGTDNSVLHSGPLK